MRKWIWLMVVSLFMGGAGIYGYFVLKPTQSIAQLAQLPGSLHYVNPVRQDGDDESEICEVIEPLQVEGSAPTPPRWESVVEEAPLLRVVMAVDGQQPPRPDSEPGQVVRMPYADEDEIVGFSFDTVLLMLESALPRLNLFGNNETSSPEESENPNVIPLEPKPSPAPAPAASPAMDYHHSYPHCPYHGGCTYPYYRR